MALYLCFCGKEFESKVDNINNGHTKSCGCKKHQQAINWKHGLTGTKEHTIWSLLQGRCYNTLNKNYKRYGGRGIKVCDQWRGESGFLTFLKDMGPCPFEYSIDRIDNNGNYEPANCRWATSKTQQNNRSNNHIIEYLGQKKTLSQWAEEYRLTADQVIMRLGLKWPIEKILNTPIRKCNKR